MTQHEAIERLAKWLFRGTREHDLDLQWARQEYLRMLSEQTAALNISRLHELSTNLTIAKIAADRTHAIIETLEI